MKFAVIPDWAMPDKPGARALFEVAALAGIENKWVRLSAAQQRQVIGSPVFGKQQLRANDDGTVDVMRSTCFGADHEQANYGINSISAAAAQGKRLIPGAFGPGVYNP
jgi:hypothetical protein